MAEARSFYETLGLNVETYDELTGRGGPGVSGDVDFYVKHARQVGDPVLELGAGTGRVSWALAQAGFTVVGLELSPAMLRCAEAKAAAVPASVRERVRFVPGDMADFELHQTFPLAIIPYRAFQSLTSPADQRRALHCIHRHLDPGGRLIVDLFDPRLDSCVPDNPPTIPDESVRHPTTGNDVLVQVLSRTNDPVRQVLTEVWRFSETSAAGEVLRQEEEVLTLRWTYRQEMRYLFELTGFEVEDEFSDYAGSPPAYGGEQLWVVRRP